MKRTQVLVGSSSQSERLRSIPFSAASSFSQFSLWEALGSEAEFRCRASSSAKSSSWNVGFQTPTLLFSSSPLIISPLLLLLSPDFKPIHRSRVSRMFLTKAKNVSIWASSSSWQITFLFLLLPALISMPGKCQE